MNRSLYLIAREIRKDWKKVNYAAEPYLVAMSKLDSVDDTYYTENGRDIVARFLCNASTWRGETARRIKKELNALLNS